MADPSVGSGTGGQHTAQSEGHSPLPEAPVSWNCRYRSSQGYDCQITLRGHDVAAVLRQAHTLMDLMATAGATPGNGQAATKSPADPQACPEALRRAGWCTVHQCQMTRREKNGEAWYSHKAPDGSWCRGATVPSGSSRGN